MNLKVTEVIQRAYNVKSIRFEKPNDFTHRPGQFVLLSFDIYKESVKRAYSIASSPTENFLEITFKLVVQGKVTPVLWNIKAGDVMDVKGPYGFFTLEETHLENMVLIAGGTEITPMRSIIRYCVDKKLQNAKISLIHGARTPEELIYMDEMEKIHKSHENLNIFFTVNEDPSNSWPWHRGNITVDFIKENVHDFLGATYYLCGPPIMIETLLNDLEQHGVNPSKIHIEKW